MQLKLITKSKMKVGTYTSNFERAEMNMLEVHLGKGKHVGCLFHWKQEIFNYLKEKCGLGDSISLETAMKVGGLDILCVLPRCKVLKYGISFIHSIIKYNIPCGSLRSGLFFGNILRDSGCLS
jgi:hypothetical protein